MPSSQDFNEICYLARYPDLSNNGWMYKSTDGTWKYGNPHGRETRKLTDTGNAFWHWENFGLSEGRVCGCDLPGTNYALEFNAAAYLARYPDVRGTSILASVWAANPLGHYQTIGIQQGRHPGFEILTAGSPVGMVTPGTTTLVQQVPVNQSPGDGTIVTPISTDTGEPVISDDNTAATVIGGNPLLIAVGAGLLLLLLYEGKKKKGSSRRVTNNFFK